MVLYIIVGILLFGLLIAVHEGGHFLAAKRLDVQVNEFSIGMGPAIFSRQKGETLYSLRAFPIGGYCAMEGEDEDSADERALGSQSLWKQLIIFAAGPLMNFLTGLVILLGLYAGIQVIQVPAIAGVAPEFESYNGAAMEQGDIFWSINGERVYLYSDVSLLMSLHQGQPMDLVVLRDGEKVELNDVTWGTYTGTEGETYQGYGVYIARDQIEEANLWTILKTSWLNTIDFVRIVRLSLQMLVTGQAGMDDLSGPVGIVSSMTEAGEQAQELGGIRAAVESMFYFAAMLAVNLAVMNLLPIPALDGGHILFLVVDAVSMLLLRKKVPARYMAAVNTAGFVVLMGFMLIVTVFDVFRLF